MNPPLPTYFDTMYTPSDKLLSFALQIATLQRHHQWNTRRAMIHISLGLRNIFNIYTSTAASRKISLCTRCSFSLLSRRRIYLRIRLGYIYTGSEITRRPGKVAADEFHDRGSRPEIGGKWKRAPRGFPRTTFLRSVYAVDAALAVLLCILMWLLPRGRSRGVYYAGSHR